MKLLVCATDNTKELYEKKLKKFNVEIIQTECDELQENYPVVIVLDKNEYYKKVSPERIIEVFKGSADDLKIQTARLFDVSMMMYVSGSEYRKYLSELKHHLFKIDEWNEKSIKKEIKDYSKDEDIEKEDLKNTIKMALLKTTKTPPVELLMVTLGKEETLKRINTFLEDYKYKY